MVYLPNGGSLRGSALRVGWKAATSSLKHQIAAALNSDMGVMTSLIPAPDCGRSQTNCGNKAGSELGDEHLKQLDKYVALLGVRARRNLDDAQALLGETRFNEIGCGGCHRATFITSAFAPFAELRQQTIHPYTDMLLHDMGPGLADNLGEGDASGAEWRTTPLWGVGLSKIVAEGVGTEFTAGHGFLHDGRARTLQEAILWHGGEAINAKQKFERLSANDQTALIKFLESL